MKNFIFNKDGQFSVFGGVLVSGDIEAYRIGIDMGRDTSLMSAMAVCQENGEYNGDFETQGNRIFVTLANSMYQSPGFITIRFAVSQGDSVITAKEIRFRVAPANNSETLAKTESSTISDILTSVNEAKEIAQDVSSRFESCALKSEVYTKSEIERKIASVYRYMGTATDYDSLPPYPENGEVYNLRDSLKTMAYGVNITRAEMIQEGFDDASDTSIWGIRIYVDNISAFSGGRSIVMYDSDGTRIGGLIAYTSGDGYLYATYCFNTDKGDSLGLKEIYDYLKYNYSRDYVEKNFSVNKTFYFAGISDASGGSIEVTVNNAGDNAVWNGHEWDILSGTVDLSNYYTKDAVESKIAEESKINARIYAEKTEIYTKTELDNKLASYSTTENVSEMINSYVEEAILGGAW